MPQDRRASPGQWGAADTPIAEYRYDPPSRGGLPAWPRLRRTSRRAGGLGRRITKLVLDHTDAKWDRTDYFYNDRWQVLEERLARNLTATEKETTVGSPHVQYVWDIRYLDSPICRFRDTTGDGQIDEYDETLYYLTDANHNVTAVVDPSGNVLERYLYDAYGRVHVLNGAADPDGTVLAEWTLDPDNVSDVSNEILYAGYRHDPETLLYHVRHRYLHATLGRWLTSDPEGYVDGMSLYEYCRSGPVAGTDPTGLERIEVRGDDVWWVIEEEGYLWDSDKRWFWLGKVEGDSVRVKADFSRCGSASMTGKSVSLNALKLYADRESVPLDRIAPDAQEGHICTVLGEIAPGNQLSTKSGWSNVGQAAWAGLMVAEYELRYAFSRPLVWLGITDEFDSVVEGRRSWVKKANLEGTTSLKVTRGAAATCAAATYSAAALKAAAAAGITQVGTVPLSQAPNQAREEIQALCQGLRTGGRNAPNKAVLDKSWKNLIRGRAHGSGAHRFRAYREAIRWPRAVATHGYI